MTRLDRVDVRLLDRRVAVVFAVIAAVPTVLAAYSFLQPFDVPRTVLSGLEVAFRYLVYAPVALVRDVLYEPVGLGVVLGVPIVGELLIVATLLGWYYLLAVAVVTTVEIVRESASRRFRSAGD